MSDSELPEGWTKKISRSSNKPYYVNKWTNKRYFSLVQKCFDKILISVNGIDHQDLPKNHKRRKKCNVLIFWLNIVILDDQHLGVATISLFLKKRL